MREEARRWLAQGDADLAHARASIQAGFYFVAAFACHQAVGKWLKGAVIHLRRTLPPRTHNLVELGRVLEVPEDAMSDLRLLNPEYATSRYPDAANGIRPRTTTSGAPARCRRPRSGYRDGSPRR